MSRFVPVVVGVADVVNRSTDLKDAREPADLIQQAIEDALEDTELSEVSKTKLRNIVESISIVRTWTWPYLDLPGLLSSRLRIDPNYKEYTENGGDKPVKLFNQAAKRIADGSCKVAIVAGGEALASLSAFAKAKKLPPPGWTVVDGPVDSVFSPTTSADALHRGVGKPHKIGAPIQGYPLFENGLRAHIGQTLKNNHQESAQMYGNFAKVAQQNEYAWNYGMEAATAAGIGKVGKKNRMICFPYPLLMNAFNTVNLAAACILTSTTMAETLGVPQEKWIYPLGGAGTRDSYDFWERPNFYSSPSIERSIDAALQTSDLKPEDVDCFDFYSCFPVVPKVASRHLGISLTNPEKPITLLGGLTSFGGAGNNYSMHVGSSLQLPSQYIDIDQALTAMVRELRKGTYRTGLVLANGGIMTYQYAVCLSREPRLRVRPFPVDEVLPEVITDLPIPVVDVVADGDATIETYTVDFDRYNRPIKGHIVGRLKHNDHRFLANHGNESTLQQLASWTKEPIGREGTVRPDPKHKGRNLFVFDCDNKL